MNGYRRTEVSRAWAVWIWRLRRPWPPRPRDGVNGNVPSLSSRCGQIHSDSQPADGPRDLAARKRRKPRPGKKTPQQAAWTNCARPLAPNCPSHPWIIAQPQESGPGRGDGPGVHGQPSRSFRTGLGRPGNSAATCCPIAILTRRARKRGQGADHPGRADSTVARQPSRGKKSALHSTGLPPMMRALTGGFFWQSSGRTIRKRVQAGASRCKPVRASA